MMGFAAFILVSEFFLDLSERAVFTATEKTGVVKLQVDVKQSIEDGEKCFSQLSSEGWGKFDEETLVNVNNVKRQSTPSQRGSGFSNQYIVITILVAAEGGYKLPTINGSGEWRLKRKCTKACFHDPSPQAKY